MPHDIVATDAPYLLSITVRRVPGGVISNWLPDNMKLVGNTHIGTQDPGYIPGPYSKYTEGALEQFARWYDARLRANGV